jgi:hypothetical protein
MLRKWNEFNNVRLRDAYNNYENGGISKQQFKQILTKDIGINLSKRADHYIDANYGGMGTFNKFIQVMPHLGNPL